VRNSLLEVYDLKNNWAKAVELQQTIVEDLKNQTPETSPEFSEALVQLSVYLLRDGKTSEAERHFEKAYRNFQNNKSSLESSLDFRHHIGECLLLLNRSSEALPLLEENYEFYKANYPPNFHSRIRAEKLLAEAQKSNN